MKATDLMIGDWVRIIDDETDKSFVGTVTHIDGELENVNVLIAGDTVGYPYSIDCIEPIPLTPEILVKNGFKQTGIGGGGCIIGEYAWGGIWDRKSTTVTITFYKGLSSGVALLTKIETTCSHEGGVNMVHSCDIENIHELQRALQLCGINKTIEL